MKPHVRTQSRRRGAALVEMALVLPLFMMVVLGIIEFGRAMMVGQLVTNSAREGARKAVLGQSTNSEVEEEIRNFLQGALRVGSGDIDVTITIEPHPENDDPGNQLPAGPRDLVTVRVEVPFNKVNYLPGNHLAGAKLVGQSSMRHE